ncbi:Dysferlin [Bienertia sinuspersici]
MTKKYKYLDELTDKTRDYKVKVKVIEKSRPKQSPGKPARQPLVLRDEKGTTMRGIIFGSDIPLFEQAIVRDGEYEIDDAIIAPVTEQYRQKEKEFQMTFTRRMELIPVGDESSNPRPKYLQIQSIPRTGEASNNLIAKTDCEVYTTWNTANKVAGFTAMRVKTFNGSNIIVIF